MNKLYKINHQEVFQNAHHKKQNYFEGWYFKNTSKKFNIAFIPGINGTSDEKNAFIQIITNDNSYFVKYNIEDFEYGYDPFYIKIGNNYFTKEYIHVDINDDKQNLHIFGNLEYSKLQNIKTTFINPNIMGPFSYIPFMECNHAIIAMKMTTNGTIKYNNQKILFKNGISYIEKDWGISFPKQYVWCQANNFDNESASLMLSIANIPFKLFTFEGFIGVLKLDGQEYRFTTYNFAKIISKRINDDQIDIVLKKKDYTLHIKSMKIIGHQLLAPVKGNMSKNIYESINSSIKITLKKKKNLIYSGTSKNCGLEIVAN